MFSIFKRRKRNPQGQYKINQNLISRQKIKFEKKNEIFPYRASKITTNEQK